MNQNLIKSELMSWKAIKEFLRPDWRKLIIFIFILHPLYFMSNFGITFIRKLYLDRLLQLPLVPLHLVRVELWKPSIDFIFFVLIIMSLLLPIYWYVLSCIIVWACDKVIKIKNYAFLFFKKRKQARTTTTIITGSIINK
jgi:hypothetical protein